MLSEMEKDVVGWLQTSPLEAEPGVYPKLFFNVNLPPVIIKDAEAEYALGDAWRALNVVPLPDVPTVSLEPSSDSVADTAETASFHVTITGPGVSGTWTPEKEAAATWLSIIAPTTPQTVDGNVTYAVTANIGVVRSAEITVNGKVFTVTQAAGV